MLHFSRYVPKAETVMYRIQDNCNCHVPGKKIHYGLILEIKCVLLIITMIIWLGRFPIRMYLVELDGKKFSWVQLLYTVNCAVYKWLFKRWNFRFILEKIAIAHKYLYYNTFQSVIFLIIFKGIWSKHNFFRFYYWSILGILLRLTYHQHIQQHLMDLLYKNCHWGKNIFFILDNKFLTYALVQTISKVSIDLVKYMNFNLKVRIASLIHYS